MIGKLVSFLAVVALTAAAARDWVEVIPYEGVNPLDVYCDALGQVHLLIPHESNCSRFYQCVHGIKVERECAPGIDEPLVFDFPRQVCNWAWAVECTLVPYDHRPTTTPAPELDTTLDPEGSGEEVEIAMFPEEAGNGLFDEHLTAEASGTVRPVAALSARQGNNANALYCHDPNSAARQVPYKGDCQRYWKCVAGVPQTFYCSDGLFFNEATEQCDHEANAKCSIQITEELGGEFIVYDN